MMPHRPLLFLLMTCWSTGHFVVAQNFSMLDPEISACAGVFFDSGGPSGQGYDNDESLTTTICPDQPEGSVSLYFVLFDLDVWSTDDELVIHDGPSASAPTIGTFTGTALQGQTVVASAQNPSGCLTLEFTSNEGGTGYFAATIACTAPCPAPLAVFTTDAPDTARICIGDVINVDGSASLAAPGRTIAQWVWIRPGLAYDTTSTPYASLAFPTGGPAHIALQVIDNLGCTSEIFVSPAPVLVSQAPVFNGGLVPSVACVGVPIILDVDPTQPPMLSEGGACAPTGEPMYLPDDIGLPFVSETTVNSAQPGAILTDIAQLGNICLDIEHSFMGDLVIELACPAGSTVTLYQQGGGQTFLGEANDQDGNSSAEPGTCFTYCFSADPDFGTWADCSQLGATPNVIPVSHGIALAPGSYQSVEPLDGLLGCPLNGVWTLTVTDLAGADNGFLCNWCVGPADAPNSTFLAFGPVLGTNNADSSTWAGMNVVNDTADPTSAEAIITETGTHEFIYSVTDSYGCVHDTTFSTLVVEVPAVDAGPDLTVCADSVMLSAAISGITEATCSYTLTLFDSAGDGWNGGASLAVTIGGATTNHAVPPLSNQFVIDLPVTSGQTVQLVYTAGTVWNNENSILLVDDLGNDIISVPNGPSTGVLYSGFVSCTATTWTISWEPVTGLSDPQAPTTWAFPPVDTEYSVVVTVLGPAGCTANDAVSVSSSTDLPLAITYNETTELLCASEPGFETYEWYCTGLLIEQNEGPCLLTNAPGAWVAIGTNEAGCIAYSDTVLICPEVTAEYNSGVLITQTGFASYAWTLNGQPLPGFVGPLLQAQGNGTYTVTITTAYGCTGSASIEVTGFSGLGEYATDVPTMAILPVPNNGQFTVAFENAFDPDVLLSIVDITGRVILELRLGALHGRAVVPIELGEASGAYVVRAYLSDRTLMRRIIVSRP